MGLLLGTRRILTMNAASAALPWWNVTGNAADAVGIYQFENNSSLVDSYINLATPGKYNLTLGSAPTWNAISGATFNGTSQWLGTGITPDLTWTMVVKFSGAPSGNQVVAGYYLTENSAFALRPNFSSQRTYWNGANKTNATGVTAGVMAIAGKTAYLNGASDGSISVGGTANAATINIGRSNSVAIYYGGNVQTVAIYNTTLLAGQMATLYTNMLALPSISAPTANIVCEGDSLTVGQGSTTWGNYPAQMWGLLGRAYRITNIGTSGQTIDNMAADATTTDALISGSYVKNILCMWAGTNDIYFGDTGATAYSDYVSYCQARRTAGWKVVAFTMLPRSGFSTPVNFETHRQTFNTSVRANWATFADALADVAADSRIGDAGDETNTTYYGDLVHLTDAGYAIVAEVTKSAILPI